MENRIVQAATSRTSTIINPVGEPPTPVFDTAPLSAVAAASLARLERSFAPAGAVKAVTV